MAKRCQRLLEANTILATVQWRAKSPASLLRKLEQMAARAPDGDGLRGNCLLAVSDLAGVRIKTYAEIDRDKVVEDIRLAFGVRGDGGEAEGKDDPSRHHRAVHRQGTLPRGRLSDSDPTLHGETCSDALIEAFGAYRVRTRDGGVVA